MKERYGRFATARLVQSSMTVPECFFSFHVCRRRLVCVQIKYRARLEKSEKEGLAVASVVQTISLCPPSTRTSSFLFLSRGTCLTKYHCYMMYSWKKVTALFHLFFFFFHFEKSRESEAAKIILTECRNIFKIGLYFIFSQRFKTLQISCNWLCKWHKENRNCFT